MLSSCALLGHSAARVPDFGYQQRTIYFSVLPLRCTLSPSVAVGTSSDISTSVHRRARSRHIVCSSFEDTVQARIVPLLSTSFHAQKNAGTQMVPGRDNESPSGLRRGLCAHNAAEHHHSTTAQLCSRCAPYTSLDVLFRTPNTPFAHTSSAHMWIKYMLSATRKRF